MLLFFKRIILLIIVGTTFTFAQNKDTIDNKKKEQAEDHVINGALAEMKEQYAEAILEYQDALELDPQPGVHFAISKCYLRIHKFPQALKHAQSAAHGDEENVEYWTLLGSIFSATNQIDSAETVYKHIIDIDSTEFSAYYKLGEIYESSKPLQALDVYNKLLKLTGPEWNVLVKIADLNERMGNVDKTIEIMEKLVKLNPSNLMLQKLLINSYISNSNYAKAISAVDNMLVEYPDDIELIEAKAKSYVLNKEWEKGKEQYKLLLNNSKIKFEGKLRIVSAFTTTAFNDSSVIPIATELLQIVDKDSSDWQVKGMLSELAEKSGNDSLSIQYLKEAVKLAEWNAEIWSKLGVKLFESQKYEEAFLQMKKGLAKFPNDYVMNFVCGYSLSLLNRHADAAKYLEKATILNPNDPNSLSVYAFTLQQLKREDDALRFVLKALNIEPENSQLLGMAGMIYDNKKMWAECDDAYERALKIDSLNALVNNNYAYSLSERNQRLDEALKMVEISVKFDSTNSSYLDTMGWVYFKLKQYDKAVEYILKAIKADEQNPTQYEHLGDIYFEMGNNDKAFDAWERSLELDENNSKIKEKLTRKTNEN